jgi:ATP-binding cassette subfamily B protein
MMRLRLSGSGPGSFQKTIRLVWESGPRWIVIGVALLLLQTGVSLAALYLLKLWVDAVALSLGTSDPLQALSDVRFLIFAALLVALFGTLCSVASDLVNRAQSQAIADHVQSLVVHKAAQVELSHYENAQYYDMLHRVQFDASWRPREVLSALLQGSGNVISLVAVASLLFWVHWSIPLVLIFTALPELVSRLRYSAQLHAWETSRTRTERQASYLNWLLTRDTHAKEIRLFNLGPFFHTLFDEIRTRLRGERFGIAVRKTWVDLGARGSATVLLFALYGFLAYLTLRGRLSLGTLVMCLQAIQRGFGHLTAVAENLARLYENNLFLTHLHELLAVRNSVRDPVEPKPVPRPLKEGIVFENVSFRYPGGSGNVLSNLDLTIGPQEHIALVGRNGVGKTTLVKLLCRLYDPTEGRILIDGIDLREFDSVLLRKEISVIFQDFAKYQLTARENIWLGDTSVVPDDVRIQSAALRSGAEAAIGRLPRKYDSVLGKWFEDGQELSVGEWQKVAIARAFYRNAQILVLDEPTSALDPRAEFELFESFERLTRGVMSILISHRLSTVKLTERIYVMEGGRIAQAGTHEELMKRQGYYADLFSLQARSYR